MTKIILRYAAILVFTIAVSLWYAYHGSQVSAQVVTFNTGQVSCAGTVTVLLTQSQQRTGLLITNPGTVAVYIGNTTVATTTGAYLSGGASISIPTKDAVSCISSGASQTVTYLQTYGTF